MKKLISLLLVLTIVCSVLPFTASAASPDSLYAFENFFNQDLDGDGHIGKPPVANEADKEDSTESAPIYNHDANDHEFGYASNAKYHWLQCACGCKISMEPHVDPLDTTDDYCFCGYHFSDNAELVTLWLQDCKELKNFRKNVYEYETDAYTYKEVNELKRIATRTFDSEATVELPEDLTLKEGENKFEIKVTAENKKVTKVYTVIVTKEAQK